MCILSLGLGLLPPSGAELHKGNSDAQRDNIFVNRPFNRYSCPPHL